MDPLTAAQVRATSFPVVRLRGYDTAAVDAFRATVADEVARLAEEVTRLQAVLAAVPEPVDAQGAATEQAAAVLAGAARQAEEMLAEARAEADTVEEFARAAAERMAADSAAARTAAMTALEQDQASMEAQVDDLRAFEREYRARLRAYLTERLADLDVTAEDALRLARTTVDSPPP